MKRLVFGNGEDFEMLEEISLIAHFNDLFFEIRQKRKTCQNTHQVLFNAFKTSCEQNT
jgi:hypothetical protein